MELVDLHGDALSSIMYCMTDYDLAEFASTCKYIYAFARPILIRRERIWTRSSIDLSEVLQIDVDRQCRFPASHPLQFITKLLADPKHAEDIKRIKFMPNDVPGRLSEHLVRYEQSQEMERNHYWGTLDRFKAELGRLNDMDEYLEILSSASENLQVSLPAHLRTLNNIPAFFLLLSLCANIEELQLVEPSHPFFESVFCVVERAYGVSIPSLTPSGFLLNNGFGRLERLEIFPSTDGRSNLLGEIIRLCMIPTLRELRAHKLIGENIFCWTPWGERSSKLEFVTFIDCFIDPKALAIFVSGLPQLKLLLHNNAFKDGEYTQTQKFMAMKFQKLFMEQMDDPGLRGPLVGQMLSDTRPSESSTIHELQLWQEPQQRPSRILAKRRRPLRSPQPPSFDDVRK